MPRSLTLVVATTNPGKIREIAAILQGAPVDLRTLADFPPIAEPDETGATFAENARLKALYYSARRWDCPAWQTTPELRLPRSATIQASTRRAGKGPTTL